MIIKQCIATMNGVSCIVTRQNIISDCLYNYIIIRLMEFFFFDTLDKLNNNTNIFNNIKSNINNNINSNINNNIPFIDFS